MTVFLLDATLKATAALLLAAILTAALRRGAAALRHLVWATALAGLLVLPGFRFLGGRDVVLPFAVDASSDTLPGPHAVAELPVFGTRGEAPAANAVTPAAIDPALEQETIDLPPEGFRFHLEPTQVWWIGALLAALPLVLAMVRLWQLRRAAQRVESGPVFEVCQHVIASLGLRRRVSVLRAVGPCVPMTWGVLRPVVLLPHDAAAWPTERLRVVLLHELTHVRRWDCATLLLANVARACFWFHPLVWWAVHRLKAEQERACDDAVLHAGAAAPDYAQHLLSVLARVPSTYVAAPVALAMGRARRLERRLIAILDGGFDRHPPAPSRRLLVLAGVTALLLPLAAVRFQLHAAPVEELSETAVDDAKKDPASPPVSLTEVRDKVKKAYVGELDDKALVAGAIKGMLESLHDPYAEYLDPAKIQEFQRQVSGSIAGVGVQIRARDGKIVVQTPLEGSPAYDAGLRPDDVIEAVGGQALQGLEIPAVVQKILGKPGTVVKLKVRHPDGTVIEPAVMRKQVRVPTVYGIRRDAQGRWDYLADAGRKVGYLRVQQFNQQTAQEVRDVVAKLKKQGLKGLILDLRGCPGGLLKSAVDVANALVADGLLVTIKGHDEEKPFKAEAGKSLGDFPLLVLIDGHTASAAEIVAGALKDRQRAVLLGDRTYGKGSVQTVIDLPGNQGSLKLTSAFYLLPSGRNIQKTPGKNEWGVDPTDGFYLPLTSEQTKTLQENQHEREKLGTPPRKLEAITPERIERDYGDPQLAGAVKAMAAKLDKGEFAKVGQPVAALQAQALQRERLEKIREGLKKNLDEVNKDLAELEKAAGGKK